MTLAHSYMVSVSRYDITVKNLLNQNLSTRKVLEKCPVSAEKWRMQRREKGLQVHKANVKKA